MKFIKAAISVIALAMTISALPIKIEERTNIDDISDLTVADIYVNEEAKHENALKSKPFRAYKHNTMENRIEMFGKKKEEMKQQSSELRYSPNIRKIIDNKKKASLHNNNRHGLTRVKRDQYRNKDNRKHELKNGKSHARFENNFRMKKIKSASKISRSSRGSVRGL